MSRSRTAGRKYLNMKRKRLLGSRRRFGRNIGLWNMRTGGLLSIEKKFLDLSLTPSTIANVTDATGGEIQPDAGCTGCLSAPAQGDGPQNREGKQINIAGIFGQGVIYITGQSALASLAAEIVPDVFIALVMDTQTNGVTINSEDVFQNICAEAGTMAMPFRNMSNTSRFRVLAKRLIPSKEFAALITTNDSATTTTSTINVHIPWKLGYTFKGGLKVNFTTASTTADVANVVDNSIHLIAYSTSGTMTPTIQGAFRMRFVG